MTFFRFLRTYFREAGEVSTRYGAFPQPIEKICISFNPFVPNVPFLYLLKTSENRKEREP